MAFYALKVKVPLICLATQCVSLRSEGRYFLPKVFSFPISLHDVFSHVCFESPVSTSAHRGYRDGLLDLDDVVVEHSAKTSS